MRYLVNVPRHQFPLSASYAVPTQRCFHSSQPTQFLDDIVNSVVGNGSPRVLTAQRTLPFPKSKLFRIVASVDEYPQFLPFLESSKIISRSQQGWPALATLNVGYAGYSESFTSQVDCDEEKGIVRARSGDSVDDQTIRNEGLFKTLDTIWRFTEVTNNPSNPQTQATLSVEVKFRNPVYDAFLVAVESKVANTMIEAFERRLKETGGR